VCDIENRDIKAPLEALGGKSLGETLLTPTKISGKPILSLLEKVTVKGISHITGGGFYENIPRSIKKGLGVKVDKKAVKVLPIFELLMKEGNIPERDMFNTYNMGVGMTVVVSPEQVDEAIKSLKASGEDAYVIGTLVPGEGVTM
ncbi:MAG: phosphoribosylformylglycinamidine cyclo-ligase, partial [Lachnospiraceae bacterium]|nr:phosphoribosylformylglycinamidine cyclo-ligase [Lachnospiraceae bacterium]